MSGSPRGDFLDGAASGKQGCCRGCVGSKGRQRVLVRRKSWKRCQVAIFLRGLGGCILVAAGQSMCVHLESLYRYCPPIYAVAENSIIAPTTTNCRSANVLLHPLCQRRHSILSISFRFSLKALVPATFNHENASRVGAVHITCEGCRLQGLVRAA